ncbi:MAG: extracellular solute-binding protein [Candidatus Sericytochromatia bacterium]|nr:extracellular solute-binding protein [Candidatus Tanganyikabacteria bacterium]
MRTPVARKFAKILVVAALTACSTADGPPTLTVWHAWGGAELTTLKALVRRFQDQRKDVKVLALQIPHDKLLDKYIRSSAANGGPDILIGDNDWSGSLAESELLASVFDFAPGATGSLFPPSAAEAFPPGVMHALRVGEKVYAWPESVETVVVYHNRNLLAEVPSTVPALLDAAAKLRVPDGYGLVFNTSFYFFAGYFLGGGGTVFGPDNRLALDTPGGRRMLGWLGAITRAPGVLATNDYGKADSLYKQGKAAMIVNGPWALADYKTALGPALGVAPLPRLADGAAPAPWIGVKCLMVNANASAAQRKLARAFLAYMAEPAQQLALAEGAGHIPARSGVELPADSPLRVFQAQVRTGTPKSADPRLKLVWAPLDRAIQEVTVHGKDVGASLDRAQRTVDAQLAAVEANR